MKPKGLREIEFGFYAGGFNQTCIYGNGHIDPEEFLGRVRTMANSDVPDDARCALMLEDVQHIRFRPMSPSEAESWGCDSGVVQAEASHRGYPVTAVFF